MGSSSEREGTGGSSDDERLAGSDTVDAVGHGGAPSGAPPPGDPGGRDYRRLLPVDPDHYVIGEPIGRGGMGRIFAARDRRVGRPVALKQLLPGNSDASLRFEQEARITAGLQHPGIVNVYEAGVWPSGEPFYAMKLIVGRSVDKVVAEKKDLRERLALLPHAIAVGDALAYAHSRRVIHRDLKPANVLIGEFGETVVIDWGLAKDLSAPPGVRGPSREMLAAQGETGEGHVLGTPAYMPPEQARGEAVDETADVYALGALLYHMMAGTAPYGGASSKKILDQVVAGPQEPLETRQPGVPADLVAIVQKSMSRSARDRYPTAAEMTVDLKRFQTGQLVGAYRYSRRERVVRLVRRYRAVAAVIIVALGALALIGGLSVARVLDERAVAERERALAKQLAIDLLEEQGRRELKADRAGPALVYLGAAVAEGDKSAAVRLLVADARQPFELQRFSVSAHEGRVHMATFSPDGSRILSAGQDRTARVWDRSLRLQFALKHDGAVYHAAASADGTRIVTASEDGSAGLWDEGGSRVAKLAHRGPVHHAAFSEDGRFVVTASADGRAIVWDAKTGERVVVLDAHTDDKVLHAEFSQDGTRVVTASMEGTATVWTLDGKSLRILRGHSAAVTWAAFSTDLLHKHVVTASADGTARVWNTDTGRPVAVLSGHSKEVSSAIFSLDDERVVTASRDGTARVWDPATGKLLKTLTGHAGPVMSASYSPDQKAVLTAGWDGVVRLWNPETATFVLLEGHAGRVRWATFDCLGARPVADRCKQRYRERRILSAGDDGTVRVWAAKNPRLIARIATSAGQLASAAFDPTGTLIITGSSDMTARIWNAKTGEQSRLVVQGDTTVFAAAFSPDGTRVVTASGDGNALIHFLQGHRSVKLVGHKGDVYAAAFDPTGKRVATGGADATVRIWDATSGRLLKSLDGHLDAVNSVHFAPHENRLVTASDDQTAVIWDLANGTRSVVLDGHGVVSSAEFAPDGRRVLLGGFAGARVVNTDGKLLYTLEEDDFVNSVTFSPDGAFAATAADRMARLWDAESGKLLTKREGQVGELLSVAFSPDGNRLVTAGRDGTAFVWDVRRDNSSAEELDALLDKSVPWRLLDGRLIPTQSGEK